MRTLTAGPSRQRRWQRLLLSLLLGIWLSGLLPLLPAAIWARPMPLAVGLTGSTAIGITKQPFYPELQATVLRWKDSPLGAVVGESPRATLLNFYAVMVLVNQDIQQQTSRAEEDPGFFWSDQARARLENANRLFALAETALDASVFPQSVRDDMRAEAALQLKEVLDFVFNQSPLGIEVPNVQQLKQLNNLRSKPSQSWTLPETSITLSSDNQNPDDPIGYLFSAETVSQISRMYAGIKNQPIRDQPFATPGLYKSYSDTPGSLVPPKWYLRLNPNLRAVLEQSLFEQTLLQILASLTTLALYGWLGWFLLRRLLLTYRYWSPSDDLFSAPWLQDNKAWYRVLLVFPLIPLTRFSEIWIDDYINFTGVPLTVVTYVLFVLYFLTSSVFAFYLLEALGRSLSEWLVTVRGESSALQLKRVSNLVMPICRVLGGMTSIALIYQLLILLGLPPSTVLAFSAVPGLAIGLGASKLLGNLFAGLSIQTDRPVRVGEFCRIGDNFGFVTKIGLRSLELQTLESRVTIPNAIADDETIINYSRRSDALGTAALQSLDIRLLIEERLSPEQIEDLLALVRSHVQSEQGLIDPVVSIEQSASDELTLICFALLQVSDWTAYLNERERLLLRLQQLVVQVRLSTIALGVSYDTTSEQLSHLPQLIADVVHQDPHFALQSCRLMGIGDFAYNIVFRIQGTQSTLASFKDAIGALNQRLLIALAVEGIEIPYPTTVEINRNA